MPSIELGDNLSPIDGSMGPSNYMQKLTALVGYVRLVIAGSVEHSIICKSQSRKLCHRISIDSAREPSDDM